MDSFSGQTNPSSYKKFFGNQNQPNCTLKIIPKNCTDVCQPLDTFHRQLKYFAAKIYEEFNLRYTNNINPTDEITVRNNIIRTQSLLHNQLSAKIFQDMVKYSWYSSGLSNERPQFQSVKQACFEFGNNESIFCYKNCKKVRFLKCANCRKNICFECFYFEFHFLHENASECS